MQRENKQNGRGRVGDNGTKNNSDMSENAKI